MRQPAGRSISPDRPTASATRARAGAFQAVVRDEHIVIPASMLRAGANEVRLAFASSDLALNRNPEFMYTLFVPARARLAFPCFDQPDLKARYTLTLDVPEGWQAVANGAEQAREDARHDATIRFAETQPISTYLFAFAAGRFQVETAERNGRRFPMFHRETDAAKVARNRDAIFDLHAAALDWLERYTGIPYPFGKFDFLLVPSFQFGGMEHPGAIFYNASALLLDPSATQNQKLGRASLIAHETAHMWFGDLVTMRWFNDVWMKEVFANFMAAKIVNPSFPEINHELRFLYAHYPAAYDVDRTAGHQRDPPAARQPERGRAALRRDHLPEGADRHAPARDDRRRRRVPRRPARVPEAARVRQRDVAGSDRAARPAHAGGSRGLEPRLGRGGRTADDRDRPERRRGSRRRRVPTSRIRSPRAG